MLNIPPPPIFSKRTVNSMGKATPPLGGNRIGERILMMEQVLVLMTAPISQIGGRLADAIKSNLKMDKTTTTLPQVSRWRFLISKTTDRQKYWSIFS